MKLIKEKSREYKGKDYFKYKVNIPEKILKEAQFSEKDELEAFAEKGKIEIRRKK